MDTVVYVSIAAGVIAAIIQQLVTLQTGLTKYKRYIALGLSLVAGGVGVVVTGSYGTQDIAAALGAALATGQAVYALVLSKWTAPSPAPSPAPPAPPASP
jgi:hypothetical protein